MSHLRDRDEAQPVSQDCFLRAHRSLANFRGQSSLHTWLMSILVNLFHDRVRSLRWRFWSRREPMDHAQAPDCQASPELQSQLRQQVQAVWDAAGSLPAQWRTVFLLRFVEDMDLYCGTPFEGSAGFSGTLLLPRPPSAHKVNLHDLHKPRNARSG